MSSSHNSLELRPRRETSDPSVPVAGDIYFNTAQSTFMRYNGAKWSGIFMSSSTSTSSSTSSSTSITTSTSTTSTSSSTSITTSTSISTSTTTTI